MLGFVEGDDPSIFFYVYRTIDTISNVLSNPQASLASILKLISDI